MKNSLLVGTVMLAIGIAIGWIAKPVPDAGKTPVADVSPRKSTPTTSAETPPAAESPIPGKRAIRPTASAKPHPAEPSAEEMDQAKEMQAEMTKNMVDRQRQKFGKQIDRLTESLSLTGDQKAKLTAWLDERLKGFADLDLTDPASAQKLMESSKLLSDESLQAQLAGALTPDQQTALTDYQDREHRSKVDAIALKSLSNLQGIIQFEDGQRDKVYALLSESAEESLAAKSKAPDFGSMFTEGMGIEMDPYGLGIQEAMTAAIGDPTKFQDNPEQNRDVAKIIRQAINDRIDAKVEKLRPVLNDKQLEAYRTELQTKGPGFYGTALDSMEKGPEGKSGGAATFVIPSN